MGSSSIKKPHKFFDRYLDNDLELVASEMLQLREDILSNKVANIPDHILQKYHHEKDTVTSQVTGLASYYNIFTLGYESIDKVRNALKEIVVEALDYYEVEHSLEDYYIRGWLNVTYGSSHNKGIERPEFLNKPESFHEHNDGMGIPDMHGYYCVTAEPSITHYLINKTELRENHNVNNRVVASETGHPHRIDLWEYDTPRITVAYDICPSDKLLGDGISVPLW